MHFSIAKVRRAIRTLRDAILLNRHRTEGTPAYRQAGLDILLNQSAYLRSALNKIFEHLFLHEAL